jgi:DNA replication protein DnaC
MKNKELESLFEALGLRETARCFDEIAEESTQESLTYEEFMVELLGREVEVKTHKKVQRMLKDSTLDTRKTMDSFEKKRLNKRLRGQVENLLRGDFLKRTENVLAFGNPGSGKTHLLSAIAQELISHGHRVLFRTCEKMVEDLLLQKQDLNLSAYLKKLNRYELLFLDDIGYVQKSREEMEVLFSLLAYRYERGSVMVTSNLVFSKWEQIFKDPMTTAAVIDRMVHHSVIMDMNLSSYRADEAKEQGD